MKLKYDGFERVENVDPMALAKTGGECLVKSSLPLSMVGIIHSHSGFFLPKLHVLNESCQF